MTVYCIEVDLAILRAASRALSLAPLCSSEKNCPSHIHGYSSGWPARRDFGREDTTSTS